MGLLSIINKVFKKSNQPEVDSSSEADYARFMDELSEKINNAPRVNIGLFTKEKPKVEQEECETLTNNINDE